MLENQKSRTAEAQRAAMSAVEGDNKDQIRAPNAAVKPKRSAAGLERSAIQNKIRMGRAPFR